VSSEADVRSVAISENALPTSYVSKTVSSASYTRAVSNVAAFALKDAEIFVSTSAEIGPDVFSAYAEAVQSNVLFGDFAKIRGVPELKIASDDVKARHACSVERFSEDRLFYLRSRGLSEQEALASMISAKISEIFSGLPEGFVSFSESLCQRAISSIVSESSTSKSNRP
jgi:Fe-S cluster assembly scaffold protein SufB